MGSGESKPVNKSTELSATSSPAPVLGSPAVSYGSGGRRRSNRRSNRRGRGKTMRGGGGYSKTMRGGQVRFPQGGMHKGKRHSKGSRRNKSKSKSRSNKRRHH